MNRNAMISAVIALSGVAIIAVWTASFCRPVLLTRDDMEPVYQVVLCLGVLTLLAAVVWQWWAGTAWHTNGALVIGVAAAGFNCCGFVTGVITALGQL